MRLSRRARRVSRRFAYRLPTGLHAHLRTLGRLGSSHPKVGLPSTDERVCVLAAHPDDESLGCGGTIAGLTARGTDVAVVIVTDGDALLVSDERGDLASRRRAEAEEACRVLGVTPPRFLGFPDRELGKVRAEAALSLAAALGDIAPTVVMLPWFGDSNDDHRALNLVLADIPLAEGTEVWGYEIWAPLVVNRLVDITGVLERKQRALEAHASDTLLDLHAVLGLNRYRAETGRLVGTHAEAFLQAPAGLYTDWVRDSVGR